jgi:hypothetical protein
MKSNYTLILFAIMSLLSCNCNSGNVKEEENDKISESGNEKNVANEKINSEKKEAEKTDSKFRIFLEKFDKTSLPYEENPDGQEKFDKIPIDEQVAYLSKAEKLSKKDFEDMSDYTDFYYISNPLNTNNFHAIVYGRFEMGSTYYYLCTYNNQGKLISNIDFAAYELMSEGQQEGQGFTTRGSINENHEITVKSIEETRKYKIRDDGKIIRL